MNKRKAKKLTLAQLREQNKYMHARARVAEIERDRITYALDEVLRMTDALICCVAELNGIGEISIPMDDLRRTMREKKAAIEVTEETYNIKVVDACTEAEASTET